MEKMLEVFKSNEFGEIRTITINGKPMFVANDVARALGYTNPSKATNDHCKKSIMEWGNDSLGRPQEFKLIPEGDIYRLVSRSKLPSAVKFESWIFDVVLPQIRQTGGYIPINSQDDELTIMAKAMQIMQRTLEKKDTLIAQLEPLANVGSTMLASEDCILIGQLAKILKNQGINIGQNLLFEWMRQSKYICSGGSRHNNPTQYSIDNGWLVLEEKAIDINGFNRITFTTKVTPKGQDYFINKFVKDGVQ